MQFEQPFWVVFEKLSNFCEILAKDVKNIKIIEWTELDEISLMHNYDFA